MKPTGYADLHSFDEDQRIGIIGNHVLKTGATVAVLVDDVPGKAERYIRKMRERFPTIVMLEQFAGPTQGVWTIKFGPQ